MKKGSNLSLDNKSLDKRDFRVSTDPTPFGTEDSHLTHDSQMICSSPIVHHLRLLNFTDKNVVISFKRYCLQENGQFFSWKVCEVSLQCIGLSLCFRDSKIQTVRGRSRQRRGTLHRYSCRSFLKGHFVHEAAERNMVLQNANPATRNVRAGIAATSAVDALERVTGEP